MKKKELEKAIVLFDTIPGANLVDNYVSKLYKNEIEELNDFIKQVTDDIINTYKNCFKPEYIQDITKTYLVQLSEIHQCKITFNIETESADTIYDSRVTNIVMQFRSYEKSTWIDQFNITGNGKDGGINLDEYKEWVLLLRFLFEKKKEVAASKPTEEEIIVNAIDSAINSASKLKD